MVNYGLTNNLSAVPSHQDKQLYSDIIVVDNNIGRSLTARASYITNFSDLKLTLNADNLSIDSLSIEDPNTKLSDSVADVGSSRGALRVLSQDLDSVHDSISIGDQNGNFATISNGELNVTDKTISEKLDTIISLLSAIAFKA
jgi:hypothetical protein